MDGPRPPFRCGACSETLRVGKSECVFVLEQEFLRSIPPYPWDFPEGWPRNESQRRRDEGQRLQGLWPQFVLLALFILGFSFFFGSYVTFQHARPLLGDALKTCQQRSAETTIEQKACNSGAFTNLICNLSKSVLGLFNG